MTVSTFATSKINEGRKLFGRILRLRSLSWESTRLLVKNQSYINILGLSGIIGGLAMIIEKYRDPSALLWVWGGLGTMALGVLLLAGFKVCSVYDLQGNFFYKEFRIAFIPLFRGKVIDLENILQIGVDHKRQKSIARGIYSQSDLLYAIYSLVVDGAVVGVKPSNNTDGTIEHTALVYLTKDGEIGCFTDYSDKEDSDEIYAIVAQTIGAYNNIPVVIAGRGESLEATFSGKSHKFVTNPLIVDEKAYVRSLLIGAVIIAIAIAAILFFMKLST